MDEDGKRLRYGLYRDRGAARARNIVPDFSRAGYMGGGVALPARDSIPVRATIAPGDGSGDDHPRIQAAIDAVAALPADHRGLRGAVLLRRGRYALSDTLAIRVGGVVLRGEGRGADGTVLRSTIAARQGRIVEVGGREAAVPRAAQQPRRTAIAAAYVPVGAMRIEVGSAAGYQTGDRIAVVREPNTAWTGAEGIDTARYGWQASDYVMHYERVVTAVHGNTLSLDASIVDAIDARFGGGYVYRTDPRRIAQAGIEDLRLEGDPATGIARGTPDTGPYTAVRFAAVRDSWVRNVAVRYVSHGFATHNGAHFNTFEDLAYLDPRYGESEGVRRYVYVYEGNSAFNLTQRCYGEGGRHTFVTGAHVPGPNVFLDCVAANANNDSGPHHRWATGTLYDNTRGGLLRAQNRRASGTGHGWAGAQQLFWNVAHPHYLVQAPPFAMNWAVGPAGATGAAKFPPEEPAGIVESAGRAVAPRSLYLQQLRDRLGEPAVEAVTTAAQREGRIWDSLATQRGD
ncbi:hypothetical protein GLE_3671 [Lysobacter enzymogenes]|uniref:Pectate lyase superfamily protein domain-containing protein n=1 Tax=Lysobacter enzymogenes TaxID=69 RepID=A0A0S2DKE3_LYSEN|nr:hypothetical protein [Lysobacter enzymogenes]ALN59015.1 hypothetical protein GLE_3671 [Lysobacter enzymogenes]